MIQDDDRRISRRGFLARAAGGLAVALTAGRVWAPNDLVQAADRGSDGPAPLITRVARPLDAETPVEAFASYLTPNERFFVRSHFGPPAPDQIDEATWRLRVGGLVERPLVLSLQDLRRFEEVTITAVVQCSGNGRAFYRPRAPGVQWERGAVGNARWTGVRLADVLSRAGLRGNARHVHLQGADRPLVDKIPLFVRSIPVEKARHPDTILAYRMNGEPLPLLHGAPLRLITPGWMADTCLKWLTEITVGDEEAKGYYMETAYRYPVRPVRPGEVLKPDEMKPVEAMVVKSLIVSPAQGAVLPPGRMLVQGVAWTGEGKIVKVEVSTDDGRTWERARLIGREEPYAWRQWEYAWHASGAGTYTILSRATDDRGNVQPLTSPWNPGGFLWNGVDRVRVHVKG
jgi:DMSO/TMAO reductase YedYZ molybdopterin-dependent catalytic subunit